MARSEVNFIYDAAMAFRAPGLDAITATGAVGELPLDKMDKVEVGSNRNKLGAQWYHVVIVVEELDTAGGDEVYTFTVETGATGSADVEVGSLTVNQTGQYVLTLDAGTIEKLDADHEAIELNLTTAGASPSITFAAWVV